MASKILLCAIMAAAVYACGAPPLAATQTAYESCSETQSSNQCLDGTVCRERSSQDHGAVCATSCAPDGSCPSYGSRQALCDSLVHECYLLCDNGEACPSGTVCRRGGFAVCAPP